MVTANAHIGRWLEEVAHQRIHGTTGEKPAVLLAAERLSLAPLPSSASTPAMAPRAQISGRTALPIESLQHSLAVYEQLLEVRA